MLLSLLQDKLALVAHSTPEKITLPATLGKLAPVKAQQDHTEFCTCFNLEPSKASDRAGCEFCLVRDGLLPEDSL